MRHALINKDNKVVNVIIWDGRQFLPPKDHYIVRSDTVDIGDIYDKKTNSFIKDVSSEVKE